MGPTSAAAWATGTTVRTSEGHPTVSALSAKNTMPHLKRVEPGRVTGRHTTAVNATCSTTSTPAQTARARVRTQCRAAGTPAAATTGMRPAA